MFLEFIANIEVNNFLDHKLSTLHNIALIPELPEDFIFEEIQMG